MEGGRRWEEVGGGSRPDRRYSKMGRERMSEMRELFKTCPKIQFFGLSSCFQDCRGGGGGSLIKSIKRPPIVSGTRWKILIGIFHI